MPLTKSDSKAAFVSNLKAELAAGKPKDQSLAIAYSVRRRAKRAAGGFTNPMASYAERSNARSLGVHTGPIGGIGPGRTDIHKMSVPSGSYVLPSDSISHLGASNTNAGMALASHLFGHQGPYGMGADMPIHAGRGAPGMKAPKLAPGGVPSKDDSVGTPTPVITASGEFVIDPQIVKNIGKGDLKLGHAALDKFVLDLRKKHLATLRKLPKPATK